VASLINGAAPSETHTETSTTENGNDKAARSSPGADGDGPLKLAPAPKDIPAQKVDNKDGDLNALRKLDGFFHERKWGRFNGGLMIAFSLITLASVGAFAPNLDLTRVYQNRDEFDWDEMEDFFGLVG
jgi:hypothetical protein